MSSQLGRPMKYGALLLALEDSTLYSPAGVAINGENKGLLPTNMDHDSLMNQRRRVRHSMNRYRINHNFPPDGDGRIKLSGQTEAKAWFGRRWKARVLERESSR
ncbi:MAG: hypothetical protein QNK37_07020 [Acidobacteriota bacterium]|nr:hypothetical protein [Acidobacteriota bacterium]